MGTQLQIVEVCLEAIRWPRSSLTSALEKTVFMEMDPKMERKMEPRGTW